VGTWLRNLALAAVAFAGILLALEGALRLSLAPAAQGTLPHVGLDQEAQARLRWAERERHQDEANDLHIPDRLLGWRPRANLHTRMTKPGSYDAAVTTNRDGLRASPEVERGPHPGVTRIAIFGCSQTFGQGVADDETYSARLAAKLPGVEVLNFGVGGYGTDQMLLYYEMVGVPFRPDVVVLAFASYHIERNVSRFRFFAKPYFELDGDGHLRLAGIPVPTPETVAAEPAPRLLPFADRSVLLRWAWDRVLQREALALERPGSRAWTLTRAIITRFAEVAKGNDARMLLVNLEARVHLKELESLARELGIDFLHVGGVLHGVEREHSLRLPNDPHLNAEGHQIVGETLAQQLAGQIAPR
jgi:hypothetical protein